ncbi:hypothetical protein [Thioalkalivibrio sp. ALE20]|uniref:hypothetical protein n=1 Tax=Thioalkalivibrio sp. ALE20 TaxID=545275 RepID=UPI0012EA9F23|nr:hypothetical protein [Thioalkalivibrio sp. ALE20]
MNWVNKARNGVPLPSGRQGLSPRVRTALTSAHCNAAHHGRDEISHPDQPALASRLKAEPDQLLGLFRPLPDISSVLDEHGLYIRVSVGANEAMYVSGKLLEGTSLQDALPDDIGHRFLQVVRKALRAGEMRLPEYEVGVDDVAALPRKVRETLPIRGTVFRCPHPATAQS